ncbi:MAG: hypothetical protein WBG10_14585 [Pseudolabrys sp.]
MRKALIIFLSFASLGALAGVRPALADCSSDNIACNANGGGAWCGQKYTTCVKQANLAAARQKIRDAAQGALAGITRQTHPNPVPVDPLVPLHGNGSGTINSGVIQGANGGATTNNGASSNTSEGVATAGHNAAQQQYIAGSRGSVGNPGISTKGSNAK